MLAGNQFEHLHERLLRVDWILFLNHAEAVDQSLGDRARRMRRMNRSLSESCFHLIEDVEESGRVDQLCAVLNRIDPPFALDPPAPTPRAHRLTGRTFGVTRRGHLPGQQFLELRDLVLDAFSFSQVDLAYALRVFCDQDPRVVSDAYRPLTWDRTLARVVAAADAGGWASELCRTAAESRPTFERPDRAGLVTFLDERYDWNELALMLKIGLDQDLEAIAYLEEAFDLVSDRATKQGWVKGLLEAVVKERPYNSDLKQCAEEFGRKGAVTKDALRRALLEAFPRFGDLEMCLRCHLGYNLRAFVNEAFVQDALEAAEEGGWLPELVAVMWEQRPNSHHIRRFVCRRFPDLVLAKLFLARFNRREVSLALRGLGKKPLKDARDANDMARSVWGVVTAARTEGWLLDLVRALHEQYPGIEELGELFAELEKVKGEVSGPTLTGPQLGRLHAALVSAFEVNELAMILLFGLNRVLGDISSTEKPKPVVVYDLLKASASGGWTRELMRAALKERANTPSFVQAIEALEQEMS
jgi:hypothetical protein